MSNQHFYGFAPGEAERTLKKVHKRTVHPAIHHLHDVVALPGLKGLYSSDGYRVEVAAPSTISADAPARLREKVHSRTPNCVSIPTDLKVVEEPFMFAGFLSAHYGHFLIDGMSRLWARNLFPSLRILFTKDSIPASFRSEILSALGLGRRVVSVDEPTMFRKIVCPGTSFEYRWNVFSVADEPHVQAAKAMERRGTWRRPVYLSRTGLAHSKQVRKINGEAKLEAELSTRGFDIVHPETLSLSEQISLFEQAPLLVGTIGSAFHTAMFCEPTGASLAILNWGRGYENFLLVDAIKMHRSCYINSIERGGADGEHVVNVALSLRLLEEAGLI